MTSGTRYDRVSGQQGRRKGMKYAVVGIVSIILVAAEIGVAVSAGQKNGTTDPSGSSNGGMLASMKAVQAICTPTDYKETCMNSLSSEAGNKTGPMDLIQIGFQVGINQVKQAISKSSVVKAAANDQPKNQTSPQELPGEYSIDDLKNSFSHLGNFNFTKLDDYVSNLQVWLSGAITFQETCLDGFENTIGNAGQKMRQILKTSRELTRNGLAMVTEISSLLGSLNIQGLTRRLLTNEEGDVGLPRWVDRRKRRLLEAMGSDTKADVIVAQDGREKYTTVDESLKDIPKKNNKTFVIYIKEGVYAKKVFLDKKMTNVIMIGDGTDKTVITGSLNFVDGVQTFNTETFTVVGANFMAKDIKFENTAVELPT